MLLSAMPLVLALKFRKHATLSGFTKSEVKAIRTNIVISVAFDIKVADWSENVAPFGSVEVRSQEKIPQIETSSNPGGTNDRCMQRNSPTAF
nr:hypothetical protein [Tanacetum cinerariifolium]